MTKGLYPFLLTVTFMIPHVVPVFGADDPMQAGGIRPLQEHPQPPGQLQLPPVPQMESMPWLNSTSTSKGPKVDFLIGPGFWSSGPLLAEHKIARSSGSSRAIHDSLTTD
jgi:hypothetical protein